MDLKTVALVLLVSIVLPGCAMPDRALSVQNDSAQAVTVKLAFAGSAVCELKLAAGAHGSCDAPRGPDGSQVSAFVFYANGTAATPFGSAFTKGWRVVVTDDGMRAG